MSIRRESPASCSYDPFTAEHSRFCRSIQRFLEQQSTASKRFFRRLWTMSAPLREEAVEVERRWKADRKGEDRTSFDRMREMRSLQFAEQVCATDDLSTVRRNGRPAGEPGAGH